MMVSCDILLSFKRQQHLGYFGHVIYRHDVRIVFNLPVIRMTNAEREQSCLSVTVQFVCYCGVCFLQEAWVVFHNDNPAFRSQFQKGLKFILALKCKMNGS